MTIYNDGVIEWARTYSGEPFHALLSDPPYHLTSIVKRFGADGSAPAKYGTDGVFSRASRGFMGQQWDGGDIAFNPETWRAICTHLYPGAFGMAFASARGWHRLACAIEDAGMIIHPTIFLWVQGQGFPKATRVREHGSDVPAFEGYRYGAQALKPSCEPIIVFQKPYEGRPLDCIKETGAGALDIDGSRIGSDEHVVHGKEAGKFQPNGGSTIKDYHSVSGRYPANFLVQHTPMCRIVGYRQADGYIINRFTDGAKPFGGGAGHNFVTEAIASGMIPIWACIPECPARRLDTQYDGGAKQDSASGFFYQVEDRLEEADPVYYCAKAGSKERTAGIENNPHPTVKPIDLARYLARMLLPPAEYAPRRIVVPFSGVGSEMIGATIAGWEDVVGIEREKVYVEIATKRLSYWKEAGWGSGSKSSSGVEQLSLLDDQTGD